ncbi:HNH endonuclease [Streptomyces sp. Wb2n-11]|uniref:HNH endonuclease n=1 Tax=Streptomyces sp. Wb2n-11 TaxID=1030533 RepID=UPI00210008BC|nr:HNH endonuclease [Streptomyces sp. Wb2n-11]
MDACPGNNPGPSPDAAGARSEPATSVGNRCGTRRRDFVAFERASARTGANRQRAPGRRAGGGAGLCAVSTAPPRRRTADGVDVDHVQPLALGGEDTDGNVHPLRRECHRRRRARLRAYCCDHHAPTTPPAAVTRATSRPGMRWAVKCSPPQRSSKCGGCVPLPPCGS